MCGFFLRLCAAEWSMIAWLTRALPGPVPALPISGKHLRNGGGVGLRGRRKHFFNCTRDAGKRYTAVEEGLDGHLVRGIQGDAVRPTFFRRFIGQPQAREALEVGLLEIQMASTPPGRRSALRPAVPARPARKESATACR